MANENAWDQPPPYGLISEGTLLSSSTAITDNGTLNIQFTSSSPKELERLLPPVPIESDGHGSVPSTYPGLNVVIQVVGSRGDVQPFIALGQGLQRHGHRVRLATHSNFSDFVRSSNLEFYSIGGDPEDLMSYMVRNPGLIPSLESLRGGDISRKRKMINEMLHGCWGSCIKPDPISGKAFVADAIIANPPSFAHVHCAQALGVPVHIMFTMPWSATRAFPRPLAHLTTNNMSETTSNYLSYGVVDLMTWQGLGDVINGWRAGELHLEPLSATMGPDILSILKVPQTYCWSTALVPKPSDWGPRIDICGFFMRDEPVYNPPEDLRAFLATGLPPIYVGFGSIVLDDPEAITSTILTACERVGVRVIISRGWSKLGGNSPNTDRVFYLADCPHEWLFKHVCGVVHHGGAGTTACGLYNARPTMVVPFFGDQPFWGNVVASNGAGPSPIPHKSISVDNFTNGIRFLLTTEAREAAQRVATQMRQESGVETAVNLFHRHLVPSSLSCDLLPRHPARWIYSKKQKTMRLSDVAVKALVGQNKLKYSEIIPFRSREYHTENERWDPITAGASSTLGTLTEFTLALGGTFINPYKGYLRARQSGSEHGGRAAAVAVGKGLANMSGAVTKGALVDLPLALAEGLRKTPEIYGDTSEDPGKVTGWKDGTTVAAKNFGLGFYHGVTGIVTKPLEGAKEEGGVGLLKGLGKGSLGLVTKPGSAMFGLIAYPAQGVYKSIKSFQASSVKQAIFDGRMAEIHETGVLDKDADSILEKFSSNIDS